MRFGDALNRVAELIGSEELYKNIRPAFKSKLDERIIVYVYHDFKYTDTKDSVNLNGVDFVYDLYEEIMYDLENDCEVNDEVSSGM